MASCSYICMYVCIYIFLSLFANGSAHVVFGVPKVPVYCFQI